MSVRTSLPRIAMAPLWNVTRAALVLGVLVASVHAAGQEDADEGAMCTVSVGSVHEACVSSVSGPPPSNGIYILPDPVLYTGILVSWTVCAVNLSDEMSVNRNTPTSLKVAVFRQNAGVFSIVPSSPTTIKMDSNDLDRSFCTIITGQPTPATQVQAGDRLGVLTHDACGMIDGKPGCPLLAIFRSVLSRVFFTQDEFFRTGISASNINNTENYIDAFVNVQATIERSCSVTCHLTAGCQLEEELNTSLAVGLEGTFLSHSTVQQASNLTSWKACGAPDFMCGNESTSTSSYGIRVAVYRAMDGNYSMVDGSSSLLSGSKSPTSANSVVCLSSEVEPPHPQLLPGDRLGVTMRDCYVTDRGDLCPLRVVYTSTAREDWTVKFMANTSLAGSLIPESYFSNYSSNAFVNIAAFYTASIVSNECPASQLCPFQMSDAGVTPSSATSSLSCSEPNVAATSTPNSMGRGLSVGEMAAIILACLCVTIISFTLAVIGIVCFHRKSKNKPERSNFLTNVTYTGVVGDSTVRSMASSYMEPVSTYRPNLKVTDTGVDTTENYRTSFGVRGYSDSNNYSMIVNTSITGERGEKADPPLPHYEEADSEDSNYWAPASDKDKLILQLSRLRVPPISEQDLCLSDHLGSGQFGTVSKGVWHSPSGDVEVAVKSLQASSSEEERVKFLQEAAIMGQFKHPYIVRVLGTVTAMEPFRLVLELMSKGDLKHTLQSFNSGSTTPPELPAILLSFCRQVAAGMSYLSHKGFIHRDLAARNILLSQKSVCKIADFGLSRDLQDENFYTSHGGKIPVKWTAPEAINYRRYSTASDVWSYGILLYEIWSLGEKPYNNCSNQEVIQRISSGMRLAPPPGCPRQIYQLMIKCWHPEPSGRPDFANVLVVLQQPDFQLLGWSPDDACDVRARTLGSPLDTTAELYKELKDTYVATPECDDN